MKQIILRLCAEEDAQDLIEYTLLLAFVCLASAALMTNAGRSVGTIWNATSTTLANAAAKAS
jgi:Flp pilus assembly pilin Flp